jgi:Ca2+-binding RTX toxin-like protein
VILGGTGRSLLIGGAGQDTATGNSGNDILIADSADYDSSSHAHDLALESILAEWQSGNSFERRADAPNHPRAGWPLPRRMGHRSQGWMRRKEIALTAMTELREVDRDELVNVEGGTSGDDGPWRGFHPPGWHPHVLAS